MLLRSTHVTHIIKNGDWGWKLRRSSHVEADVASSDVLSARWSEVVGLDLLRDL